MATSGAEYFWMAKRVMSDYRIPQNVADDVLANAVFLAFIAPHPLSFTLIRWSVLFSIRKYCGVSKKYTFISLSEIDDSWMVFQPEPVEDKIIDLSKFRQKKLSL